MQEKLNIQQGMVRICHSLLYHSHVCLSCLLYYCII